MTTYILFFDIIDIFEKYGAIMALFVIAFLVSYLIIKNSQNRIRQQEEKIDSLYNRIDSLVNKFSTEENQDLTTKFINYAENANKIQIQLYHILQAYGAERVSIYEFHNGGKNLAGVEFKKCSNTYEAVSLETTPVIRELQNLPLSLNPLWNKILATRESINISDVNSLEDNFLKSHLTIQRIKAYYSIILEDYDNTPIGFMSLEFYKNSKELSEKEVDDFHDIALKIAILINSK
jgi:hypothetical protein